MLDILRSAVAKARQESRIKAAWIALNAHHAYTWQLCRHSYTYVQICSMICVSVFSRFVFQYVFFCKIDAGRHGNDVAHIMPRNFSPPMYTCVKVHRGCYHYAPILCTYTCLWLDLLSAECSITLMKRLCAQVYISKHTKQKKNKLNKKFALWEKDDDDQVEDVSPVNYLLSIEHLREHISQWQRYLALHHPNMCG